MPYAIYRKSDLLICALVHPRRTPEAENKQLLAEIQNVLNSELGGLTGDYAYVSLDRMPGSNELLAISESGEAVEYRLDPVIARRAEFHAGAVRRLQGLGFSDDEIESLVKR